MVCVFGFRGPGGDRLSRTLGCSIMGAGGFHVRVRDGIGCSPSAMATKSSEPPASSAMSGPRIVCDVGLRIVVDVGRAMLLHRRVGWVLVSAHRLRCRLSVCLYVVLPVVVGLCVVCGWLLCVVVL